MTELQIKEQPFPGLYLLECPYFADHRGDFTKIFHQASFDRLGLAFLSAETFVTRSNLGVLRGMHFQVAEAAHEKIVYCAGGRVLDVVVDIRHNSPYFNRPYAVELSPATCRALFVPKGFAHGFLALDNDSFMLYHVSTVHSPKHDRGVLWSSIDFEWPTQDPIISMRDSAHPLISELL